jgi:hypothetical protein
LIGDTGQLCDEGRDSASWVDEGGPFIFNPAVVESYSTDINNGIFSWVKTCSFDIQGNY